MLEKLVIALEAVDVPMTVIGGELVLAASPLNKAFIESRFKDNKNFALIMKEVKAEVESQVKAVAPAKQLQNITNAIAFFAFNERIKPKDSAKLFHDIISDLGAEVLDKNTSLFRTADVEYANLKRQYETLKKTKEESVSDEDWEPLANTYVLLPDQDRLVLGKGTKKKILDADTEARWYVATAMDEKELAKFKKSKIWKTFSDADKQAVQTAHKKYGMNLRGACPYDAKLGKHCGNVPSQEDGDIYLALRDGKKTVATVVLNEDGTIRESKGVGNTKIPTKYKYNVAWLYAHKWVKGNRWGGYNPAINTWIHDIGDTEIEDLLYNDKSKEFDEYDLKIRDARNLYREGKITDEMLVDKVGFKDVSLAKIKFDELKLSHCLSIMGREQFFKVFTVETMKKICS